MKRTIYVEIRLAFPTNIVAVLWLLVSSGRWESELVVFRKIQCAYRDFERTARPTLFVVPYKFDNELLNIKYMFQSHQPFEQRMNCFSWTSVNVCACCFWPCIRLKKYYSIVCKHSYFTFTCKHSPWTGRIRSLEVAPFHFTMLVAVSFVLIFAEKKERKRLIYRISALNSWRCECKIIAQFWREPPIWNNFMKKFWRTNHYAFPSDFTCTLQFQFPLRLLIYKDKKVYRERCLEHAMPNASALLKKKARRNALHY